MGPQNPDPNDPSNPVQADLSSSLNQPPQPLEAPVPQPDPMSAPPISPIPEPAPATPSFGLGPVNQPYGGSIGESTPSTPPDNPNFNWSNPSAPEPAPAMPTIPPAMPETPTFNPAPEQSMESAPTDLSQLANTVESQPIYTPPLSQPETLVVPPSNPEPTTLQTDGGGHGLPKWLIFVGAGLLLAVLGASAYFILGIGQSKNSTSLPATEQPTLITPPIASPVVQQPSTATSSGSFGSFAGSPTPQATSAADLLRQRQAR